MWAALFLAVCVAAAVSTAQVPASSPPQSPAGSASCMGSRHLADTAGVPKQLVTSTALSLLPCQVQSRPMSLPCPVTEPHCGSDGINTPACMPPSRACLRQVIL